MTEVDSKFAQYYSSYGLLQLLPRVFSKAGLDVIGRVLQLYYLAKSPDLPVWAKTGVFAALGYFIVTPDAIPDITPVIGFVDDLAVLSSVLSSLAMYVSPEVRSKANNRLQRLFRKQELSK